MVAMHVLIRVISLLASDAHTILYSNRASIISMSQAISLVIGEPIDILIILIKHCLVLSPVCFSKHVIENCLHYLKCNSTI